MPADARTLGEADSAGGDTARPMPAMPHRHSSRNGVNGQVSGTVRGPWTHYRCMQGRQS
jgi:hypothetical protein